MLCTFDGGYVDLQSPTGSGLAVLVYNYDGYVYPSDEARMLAATGDVSLRLGRIGEPLDSLLGSAIQTKLIESSTVDRIPGCCSCAYNRYCAPDPISAYNETGRWNAPVEATDHCKRHKWLFDFLFERLRSGDAWFEDLAYRWAQPPGVAMNYA
jgi:MoaA/NifB/PqqE/SkfB family radical SAM enzyme